VFKWGWRGIARASGTSKPPRSAPAERIAALKVTRIRPMLARCDTSRRALLTQVILSTATLVGAPAMAAAPTSGPAYIGVGPVAVTPELAMEAKYRDNIYLQEDDETDSWIAVARPTVTALAQDRENLYRLVYEGETALYDEDSSNDENNYFDNTLTADTSLLLNDRWTATAFYSYAWLHEDRGTGLTEGQVGTFISEPVEYEQWETGGSIEYDSGVGRLQLNADYLEREYTNFQELTRSRDRDETGFGAKFFYPVAPKTDIFLDYQWKDISYPNPFENVPPLDSEEYYLQGGIEWEITPNLKSSAQAGYVDKSFESSERRDWDGIGWMVDLWMQPREQDTITITGSREPDETTLQGDFIKRETVTAKWSHTWSDRFSHDLSGTLTRETYEGSINDREDDVYGIEIRVNYQFRRWAGFYVSYGWDEKDSNAENLSYTSQTVIFGAQLSL
jgi:hypothetical protein